MTYVISRNSDFNSLEVMFDTKPTEAVRSALKDLRFRWHGVKKVWYGYAAEDELRTAIDGADNGVEIVAPVVDAVDAKAADKALREEYAAVLKAHGESDYWIAYYLKECGNIVKLTDGSLVIIERPRIETRFCFGESGYDYDDAVKAAHHASTSESYFRRENLKNLKSWVDFLGRTGDSDLPEDRLYRCPNRDGTTHVWREVWYRATDVADAEEVSEADRDLLLAGYKAAYAAFEKRINTYLKRYGMSKVYTWTYWRDA